MSIFEVRHEYEGPALDASSVARDAIEQFRAWLTEAVRPEIGEPTAMTLATADESGKPSARTVLLKGFDERGFVFYTNYDSRKARELEANPRASLLFYWEPLHRQVRIEGVVEKTSREETEAYFRTRPRESQLGAWASPQSEPIRDRATLQARIEEIEARFPSGAAIPAPPHWGGYRLAPDVIEFWQGRYGRLHDRIRYVRASNGDKAWRIDRLAP